MKIKEILYTSLPTLPPSCFLLMLLDAPLDSFGHPLLSYALLDPYTPTLSATL